MFRKLARLFARPVAPQSPIIDLAALELEHAAQLLASETTAAPALLAAHPPQIEHAKKRLLFEIGLARGLQGELSIARYREMPLPTSYGPRSAATITAREGFFRYSKTDGANDWFMNFAHHDLFHGYGHFMFAQDEIQVAEHPALASAREMMLARTDRLVPMTAEDGAATPILFRNIQRTIKIDTRRIYGARFARADDATIRAAVHVLDPPTRSNILAMEAPISTGNRTYSRTEIESAFRTAYSGFRAVVLASIVDGASTDPIVLHSGNWGCGAYGGNRQLMLMVQMMAARLAGIAKLVFYCGRESQEDVEAFDRALSRRFKFAPGVQLDQVVDRLTRERFSWGAPDGN